MQFLRFAAFLILMQVATQDRAVVPTKSESSVHPKAAEQVSKPAEPQDSATELDQILDAWEKVASEIRRIDAEFTRFKYDRTFEVEKRAEGTIALELPSKARYRLRQTPVPAQAVSKKLTANGIPYAVKADEPECWHWTGPELIRIDDKERSFESVEVTANGRMQYIFHEVDVLDTIFLGRPFLLGMPAAETKKQFVVHLEKCTSDEVRLRFIPRREEVAANYVTAVLILDRNTWLAKAVKQFDATGAESVHVFRNMRVNSPTESADDLSKPTLEGYRQVQIEKTPQKDSAE